MTPGRASPVPADRTDPMTRRWRMPPRPAATAAGRGQAAAPVAGVGGGITQAGARRSAAIESLRALAALGVLEGHVFGAAVGYGAAAYATVTARMLLGGGMGVFPFFAVGAE